MVDATDLNADAKDESPTGHAPTGKKHPDIGATDLGGGQNGRKHSVGRRHRQATRSLDLPDPTSFGD